MSALNIVVISTASGGFTCASADIDVGDLVTISGEIVEPTVDGISISGYANPTTYKVSAVEGNPYARTGFTLTTITDVALTTLQGTPTGLTYIKTPSTPKASVKPKIKLGFDRTPAPVTREFTQLVDIEGSLLYDPAGTPLVTDEEVTLNAFSLSSGATSIHVNNMYNTPPISAPVEEQFPETSAVSNSLLGVPRSETSLSLFSDVSSYGIDEENWTYQRYSSAAYPYEWYLRKNPIYGDRTNPRFYEETREQALYLKSFPVQYGFPGSPLARDESISDIKPNVKKYMNFIAMGRHLYETFKDTNIEFAKRNFLNENIDIINSSETAIDIEFRPSDALFSNANTFLDVEYGDDVEDSLYQVERWTIAWQKIRDDEFDFPGDTLNSNDINTIKQFLTDAAIPGNPDARENFVILESVKTFRYQPGRVSGFTFGTRQQTDPASNANYIEWGCSNETDEYVFQLKGSTFNIVRRSTIRMPDELLLRQGLRVEDQSEEAIVSVGVTKRPALYETIIPRTLFNGDGLLGNGPSGYILSFEDVTMYKIEFSWYGAVGAKFYAYVPAQNGAARWVLMHTFVISNGLGKPILNNPDFKFKYLVYSSDHTGIDLPLYLYKYGSSYFIDGGDEGTIKLSTVTCDSKEFSVRTPVIGIQPKETMINRDGIDIVNYIKGYPSLMSINSDKDARIDIEYITGSPDGVHFSHAPSLHHVGPHPNTTKNVIFKLDKDGAEVNILNGIVKPLDYDGKIIADGVYNAYVCDDEESSTESTYGIKRRGLIGQGQGSILKTVPPQDRTDQYSLKEVSLIRGRKSDGTFISRDQDFQIVKAVDFVENTVYEITKIGNTSQEQWNLAAGTTDTAATDFAIGTKYLVTDLGDMNQEQWNVVGGTTDSQVPYVEKGFSIPKAFYSWSDREHSAVVDYAALTDISEIGGLSGIPYLPSDFSSEGALLTNFDGLSPLTFTGLCWSNTELSNRVGLTHSTGEGFTMHYEVEAGVFGDIAGSDAGYFLGGIWHFLEVVGKLVLRKIPATNLTINDIAASGVFTCVAADIEVGDFVTVSDTPDGSGTGSITGYNSPTTYRVSAVVGSTVGARTGFTLKIINADGSLGDLTTGVGNGNALTFRKRARGWSDEAGNNPVLTSNLTLASHITYDLSITKLVSGYQIDVYIDRTLWYTSADANLTDLIGTTLLIMGSGGYGPANPQFRVKNALLIRGPVDPFAGQEVLAVGVGDSNMALASYQGNKPSGAAQDTEINNPLVTGTLNIGAYGLNSSGNVFLNSALQEKGWSATDGSTRTDGSKVQRFFDASEAGWSILPNVDPIGYATLETLVDDQLGIARPARTTINNLVITDALFTVTCDSTAIIVNDKVVIVGDDATKIAGHVTGKHYRVHSIIIGTPGVDVTKFRLVLSQKDDPDDDTAEAFDVVTSIGTPTGLTYTYGVPAARHPIGPDGGPSGKVQGLPANNPANNDDTAIHRLWFCNMGGNDMGIRGTGQDQGIIDEDEWVTHLCDKYLEQIDRMLESHVEAKVFICGPAKTYSNPTEAWDDASAYEESFAVLNPKINAEFKSRITNHSPGRVFYKDLYTDWVPELNAAPGAIYFSGIHYNPEGYRQAAMGFGEIIPAYPVSAPSAGTKFTAVAAGTGNGTANVEYRGVEDENQGEGLTGFKATGPVAGTGEAQTGESYFSGSITNFHAVASSTAPIYGNDFKIHFLDPFKTGYRTGPNARHYSDYAICIGAYAPELNDDNLVFDNGSELVPFDFDDVLHVVGSHLTALVDIKDRADVVEGENIFGRMLTVDTRIPEPIAGTVIEEDNIANDSGRVCAVKGEVRTVDYRVDSIIQGTGGSEPDFPVGVYKITFTEESPGGSLFPRDEEGNLVENSSEVGVNGIGTGVFYQSVPAATPISENDTSQRFFVLVSGNPFPVGEDDLPVVVEGVTTIQTKVITLKDDWKLDERFKTALFSMSRAVKFNAQPLYLTVAMHDDARVNSIVVEEITADGVSVKTPSFIMPVASGIGLGPRGSFTGLPGSFNSDSRSSGLRFDTQGRNTLRKGTIIHSVFVAANKPEQFDLSNIFGIDRKTLSRGMINNIATYFTATSLDGSPGNIEMTLTAKEQ